jgi:hypothetical protein
MAKSFSNINVLSVILRKNSNKQTFRNGLEYELINIFIKEKGPHQPKLCDLTGCPQKAVPDW